MYLAVIEPIILYAASARSPASKKLSVQRRLSAVQRGYAQKICRSYRTSSLKSALILAGLLPLDLRIQEAVNVYEAKQGKSIDPDTLRGHNMSGLQIFTDRSRVEGKVGAALSCWHDKEEICSKKYKVEFYCTAFQAEMFALYKATKMILTNRSRNASVVSQRFDIVTGTLKGPRNSPHPCFPN